MIIGSRAIRKKRAIFLQGTILKNRILLRNLLSHKQFNSTKTISHISEPILFSPMVHLKQMV